MANLLSLRFAGVIPSGSDFAGLGLSVAVDTATNVHTDNWRLTLGNHPCDGCVVDIAVEDGDLNDDCDINLVDFAIMAGNYLECFLYPECVTIWPPGL